MRNDWKYLPLGEICDILDSKRKPITKNKRLVGSIPYYGATGILDYVKDYIFEEKLVLLGEDGAKWGAGENSAYIINGKTWVNNHAHVLRPRRDIICDEFLVCYLNYTDLSDSITGVTVPKLNQEKMRAISIPVPPLSEQERIVSLFDTQFAKIDALKANAATQLQAAKDLFQSALKQLLTPQEGWEKEKLTNVCEDITAGGDAPKGRVRDDIDEKFCYPIYSNGVENEGLYGYTDDYKYDKPAITIAARGTIGAAFIRNTPFTPIVRLITLVPNNNKANISYLYYIIRSLNIGHTGSSIPQLTVPMIKEMEFSFPSLPEQERIAARLDAISKKVKALQANYDQTINLCNDLKQSLLKSIFA